MDVERIKANSTYYIQPLTSNENNRNKVNTNFFAFKGTGVNPTDTRVVTPIVDLSKTKNLSENYQNGKAPAEVSNIFGQEINGQENILARELSYYA